MRRAWWFLVVPVIWGGVVAIAGCGRSQAGGIDAQSGLLAPAPDSPNGVSSCEVRSERRVEPFSFAGASSASAALGTATAAASASAESSSATAAALAARRRLLSALASEPRLRIVHEDGWYLHATATSLVFRFVDDVEFLVVPEAQLIHVRSRSRLGYSDFGVNRARVERLRAAFLAAP